MSTPVRHEGGCFCRAIRFRVRGDPEHSVICHCESCRRASAAPSVAWLTFARGQVDIVGGELRRFRSSPNVVRGFCAICGAQLTYETTAHPDRIDLTTASLDDPNAFAPSGEVWVREKLAWETLNPTIDHYPQDSQAGAHVNDE